MMRNVRPLQFVYVAPDFFGIVSGENRLPGPAASAVLQIIYIGTLIHFATLFL